MLELIARSVVNHFTPIARTFTRRLFVSHTVHLSKSFGRFRIAIGFRLSSTRAPYHNNLRKAVNPSVASFSGFLRLSQILAFQRLSRLWRKKEPARFALPRHLHAGQFLDSGVPPEHHPWPRDKEKTNRFVHPQHQLGKSVYITTFHACQVKLARSIRPALAPRESGLVRSSTAENRPSKPG